MQPSDITQFWFKEATPEQWFTKDPTFDQIIKDRFAETYGEGLLGKLDLWKSSPEGSLALVILLDQFPRNMFRGLPGAFAGDEKALIIAKDAIAQGFDLNLGANQRRFLYMPFMHSERLADQNEGISLFKKSGDKLSEDYAIKHRDIIARFGRFPHRNEILGRSSSTEELEFLKLPGSSF